MLRKMKSFGAGHKASKSCSWNPNLELSDQECHFFFLNILVYVAYAHVLLKNKFEWMLTSELECHKDLYLV